MRSRTLYWTGTVLFSGIILLLLLSSILYNLKSDKEIPQMLLLRDDGGKIIGDAPFPPSVKFPFGTDRQGFDIGYMLLEGAQFTLGTAILISLLTFFLAFVIGVFGGFARWKVKALTHKLFTSFYFIPQSIIAYNILYPVIWEPAEGFTTTLSERMIIEILVLAIIIAPTTSILISNETEQVLGEEFITSAKVLGGSSFFIFYKHLMPHLKTRLFVIYPKIVIQTLLIMAHLGFFTLFFGGTDVCYTPYCHPPKPIIQEWSGLMGTNYHEIGLSWWIFMAPMISFSMTILLLNGIAKCIEGLMDTAVYNIRRVSIKKGEVSENRGTSFRPERFLFSKRAGNRKEEKF
jgi:peptide/nickel transport system permease protein